MQPTNHTQTKLAPQIKSQFMLTKYHFGNLSHKQIGNIQRELHKYIQLTPALSNNNMKPLLNFAWHQNTLEMQTLQLHTSLHSVIIQDPDAYVDLDQKIPLMRELAMGLKRLHKCGFWHSNICLKNIQFFKGSACFNLPYFKMVKRYQLKYQKEGDNTLSEELGSVPEIANGYLQSEKSDVWLLGVVFLQILTKKKCDIATIQYKIYEMKEILQNMGARFMLNQMLLDEPQERCGLDQVLQMLNRQSLQKSYHPNKFQKYATHQLARDYVREAYKSVQNIKQIQIAYNLYVQQLSRQLVRMRSPIRYQFPIIGTNGYRNYYSIPSSMLNLIKIAIYRDEQVELFLYKSQGKIAGLKITMRLGDSPTTCFIDRSCIQEQLVAIYLQNMPKIRNLFQLKSARISVVGEGSIQLQIDQNQEEYSQLAKQFAIYPMKIKLWFVLNYSKLCLLEYFMIGQQVYLKIDQVKGFEQNDGKTKSYKFQPLGLPNKTKDRYTSLIYNYNHEETFNKISKHKTNIKFWYQTAMVHFFSHDQIRFNYQEKTFQLDQQLEIAYGSVLFIVFTTGHIYALGMFTSPTTGTLFSQTIKQQIFNFFAKNQEASSRSRNSVRIRNWCNVRLQFYQPPIYKQGNIGDIRTYLGVLYTLQEKQVMRLQEMVIGLTDQQFLRDSFRFQQYEELERHLQTCIKFYGQNNSYIGQFLLLLFQNMLKWDQGRQFTILQRLLPMLPKQQTEHQRFISKIVAHTIANLLITYQHQQIKVNQLITILAPYIKQLFSLTNPNWTALQIVCQPLAKICAAIGHEYQTDYLYMLLTAIKNRGLDDEIYSRQSLIQIGMKLIEKETQQNYPSISKLVDCLYIWAQSKDPVYNHQTLQFINIWQKIYEIAIDRDSCTSEGISEFIKFTQQHLENYQAQIMKLEQKYNLHRKLH